MRWNHVWNASDAAASALPSRGSPIAGRENAPLVRAVAVSPARGGPRERSCFHPIQPTPAVPTVGRQRALRTPPGVQHVLSHWSRGDRVHMFQGELRFVSCRGLSTNHSHEPVDGRVGRGKAKRRKGEERASCDSAACRPLHSAENRPGTLTSARVRHERCPPTSSASARARRTRRKEGRRRRNL